MICGKRFNGKRNMEHHVRVHTGEEPYICNISAEGFSQKTSLTAHASKHTIVR